jgi:folate-binding Fe-S cluster repair protein YgfZ/Tfp pilus assembly protein PilF
MNFIDSVYNILKSPSKFKLSNYKVIKIIGEDAESFLHNQTTNNIKSLNDKNFHTNSLLSNKGLVESLFILLKVNQTYKIIVEESLFNKTLERLNQYLISEDVELIVDNSSYYFYLGNENVQGHEGIFMGEQGVLSEEDLDIPLVDDFKLFKILSGYPVYSEDFVKPTLMNNSCLTYYAYDPKKGCFPGNETVSKVESRKGAGFKDSLLIFDSEMQFQARDKVTVEGKKVATIKDYINIDNKSYVVVDLLREFRVDGKQIAIDHLGAATVKSLPLYNTLNRAELIYDRGVEHFQHGDDKLAEDYFKLAIKFDPKFADAYESMAVLLGRHERFDEAIKYLEQLLEVDPNSVLAHTNLSMFHMKLGNIDIAEEHKSQATLKSFEKFGEEAELKRLQEEKAAQDVQELKRREGMFKEVLEIDQDDPLANYGMGEISFNRKEYAKAKNFLEKVLNADEKYSVAYVLLGKTFIALGDNQNARNTFEKGIEIAAKNGDLMPANEMQNILSKL